MRKLSGSYSVDYIVRDVKNNIVEKKNNAACYSAIYGMNFNKIHSITLSRFLCNETHMYHKKFLNNICKIFDLELEYINDDEIKVSGFKKHLDVKIFLAMFRMLFEIISSYGVEGDNHKENTINFMKDYCTRRGVVNYRCPLKRYIYFYMKNNVYQGGGHGIRCRSNYNMPIRSKSDLKKSKAERVLDFFN